MHTTVNLDWGKMQDKKQIEKSNKAKWNYLSYCKALMGQKMQRKKQRKESLCVDSFFNSCANIQDYPPKHSA